MPPFPNETVLFLPLPLNGTVFDVGAEEVDILFNILGENDIVVCNEGEVVEEESILAPGDTTKEEDVLGAAEGTLVRVEEEGTKEIEGAAVGNTEATAVCNDEREFLESDGPVKEEGATVGKVEEEEEEGEVSVVCKEGEIVEGESVLTPSKPGDTMKDVGAAVGNAEEVASPICDEGEIVDNASTFTLAELGDKEATGKEEEGALVGNVEERIKTSRFFPFPPLRLDTLEGVLETRDVGARVAAVIF